MTPDDPRLTAYVLGELDEAQKAEVEQALRESAACREEVANIRRMANWVAEEMTFEAAVALTPEQRMGLEEELTEADAEGAGGKIVTLGRVATALAAAAVITVSLIIWQVSRPSEGEDLGAMAQKPAEEANVAGDLRGSRSNTHPEESAQDTRQIASNTNGRKSGVRGRPIYDENGGPFRRNKTLPEPKVTQSRSRAVRQSGRSSRSEKEEQAESITSVKEEYRFKYGVRKSSMPESRSSNRASSARASKESLAIQRKAVPEREEARRRLPALNTSEPRYAELSENRFKSALEQPLSTFSLDVDTASYSNVRRFLRAGQWPPQGAVRIEEMINYFDYHYPVPEGEHPVSVGMDVAGAPWEPAHHLLRVGVRTKALDGGTHKSRNFVFLVDVSGSMAPSGRLPVLKEGLRMFVKRMDPGDRMAIVKYATQAERHLPSTSGERKVVILEAIDDLEAEGSTNGEDGMRLAYRTAREHFLKGGNNRVILCTDGDFNVGTTDKEAFLRMIQEKAKERIFLTVLGVGTDNYHDSRLLHLADSANGNYHYIDSVGEAYRVLVEEKNSTLVTVAKDVKVQIEFNPARVESYRLIGYEKRRLEAEDFNDDRRDAGDLGAGHTVTALYELVPSGSEGRPEVDALKYRPERRNIPAEAEASKELLTLKLRYKYPDEKPSHRLEFSLEESGVAFEEASSDFRFAASVAAFGMILRESRYIQGFDLKRVYEIAERAVGEDATGARAEFLELVRTARELRR